MQLLRKDAAKYENDAGEGYLEWGESGNNSKGFMYTEFFENQMGYLKDHLGHSVPQDTGTAVPYAAIISRCFYPNSIEAIKDNLRREGSSFAK